jgi:hypothetical protein
MSCTRLLAGATRTALLGVRFWDSVAGRAPAEGLAVTETSTGAAALTTPSNAYVFHDLPGLRAAAFGAGDSTFWGSPPVSAPFTFEVTDSDERFIPFRFTAELPQPGLFVPPCLTTGSPPLPASCVPVFSAPARPVQPGMALVRAELWNAVADAPAAGAVLEVTGVGARPWRGIADVQGRVAVQCPYPEPRWQSTSPPAGSAALSAQTWTIDVSVRYSPAQSSPPAAAWQACQPPDLCDVWTQTSGTLLATYSPSAVLPPQTLTFGRELVLRSTGQSILLVLPT